ncbi:MAG: hypothetical protein FJ098_16525 [Deltaproteobacteria bacterium]|nr:hypothetical protein [Deltaproteobacteria bacterium]
MRSFFLAALAALAAFGCDSGGSPRGGDGDGSGAETVGPGFDTLPGTDTPGPGEDSSRPPLDSAAPPPDVPPGIDALPGSLGLGQECSEDGQCQSGLCFRVKGASGCTISCASMAECQGYGLLCVALRPELSACVPPPSASGACASHADCAYPLACRADIQACELPECTWDGDCPAGQECEPASRRCQPSTCVSTVECEHPLEVCDGGACGAPECTTTEQCPAGRFCHPTQLTCQEAPPCNDEGGCNVYNQACVDGMCVPDLCVAACSHAGEQCDPATGECGLPCQGHGDCPAGSACGSAGLCHVNGAPFALLDGAAGTGSSVPFGEVAALDSSASGDPEGEGLERTWVVNAAPPGSSWDPGDTLDCIGTGCQFLPDMPGQYLLGLRVRDPAGAAGIEAQAGLWVQGIWVE